MERDTDFEHVAQDSPVQSALDELYREKYRSHAARIVNTVVGEHVHGLTIRLVARGD